MSKESSISRERAQRILASVGESAAYDPMNDYYVVTLDDGTETLVVWGDEMPLATNHTTMSWL